MLLVENTKINVGAIVLANTGDNSGKPVSMKLYKHLTVIVAIQPASGTDTCAITLKQATAVGNFGGASEKTLAFTDVWKNGDLTASDTLVRTAVVANSVTTSALAAKELYVFEIDAETLDISNDYDCVNVHVTDPGSVSTPMCITTILSEPKYSSSTLPSATID